MAIYEYECARCGTVEEVQQSMQDKPLVSRHCQKCQRVQPCLRLISHIGGIIFKGPGFYATDYRKPEKGKQK